MRVSTSLFSLLLISAANGRSLIFSDSQKVIASKDDLSVPGDNPLEYCANAEDSILTIDYVDLSPNPPEAGKTLQIEAKGTLSEDIEEGATVHLQVKYGLIRLINQEADLCEQVKNVDLKCPLKKGETTITKSVSLPREIPPGKYTVVADVYTKDNAQITCLTATVVFGHKSHD